MPNLSRVNRMAAWATAVLLCSSSVLAAQAGGGESCPVASPQSAAAGLAMASAARAPRLGDGISVRSESTGPYDPQAAAARREAERRTFERILASRPVLPASPAFALSITPQQRESIEQGTGGGRLRVGTALAIGQGVDFSRLDRAASARSELEFARGTLRVTAASAVWEVEVASAQASALRLQFGEVSLAPGVELYVYDENGRVVGPYTGNGPDGSGGFWSNSVFGDRVHVHVHAPDLASLQTSRFTLTQAMHFGSRYRLADLARQRYEVGPSPDRDFCGTAVPTCTLDGMCALPSNAGLANAVKGVAHLQYMDGADGFICTGTLLNTIFEGPSSEAGTAAGRPLYLLTANHCISNQTSAASLEAYFNYHTASCGGTCPTAADLVEVDGGTLLTTGAAPALPDFTLLRLPVPPVGAGLMRLGWTSETVGEGWYLMHLSHPEGAPLAYSHRRARLNNVAVPHCTVAPEPTFLYSGLAVPTSNPPESAGAVASGSSGSAALAFLDDYSDVQVVGQLFGHCPGAGDVCDANTDSTVDGSFRVAFPYLQRFLVDRIFANGFD
ncbi:hypothetical protein [Dokdonella sp.]|uniref:hypothetical protein n=1 Tax=Dokdonella sp. TaxID=2291710 RepID=UPI001B132496|nr:hypothetical protein [Dokdonella sp.]MBO9662400.1 hypothetical protein [Dokdonella sp.]